jgi:hypothetical protein
VAAGALSLGHSTERSSRCTFETFSHEFGAEAGVQEVMLISEG